MKIRQAILWGQRSIALVCLGSLGCMSLSLNAAQPMAQAQTSRMCVDEVNASLWNSVTAKANQGREALGKGDLQRATAHFTGALELVESVEQSGVKARLIEMFIQTNAADSGWLITEIEYLIEAGETDAIRTILAPALATTQSLPSGHSFLKTRLLSTIAAHYGAIGDQEIAVDLLSQARQAEANIQGDEFKAKALTEIAQAYETTGESAIALETAALALQYAESVDYPNPVRRAWVVQPIAAIYAEMGEIDQALQIVRSIEDEAYQDSSVGELAIAMAQAGQTEEALALLQEVTLPYYQAQTLAVIGLQLAEDGDEQAQSLFEQAIATADTDVYLQQEIAQKAAQAGFTELAFNQLASLPDKTVEVRGLLAIAHHLTNVDELETVRKALQQAIDATAQAEEYERAELSRQLIIQAIEIQAHDLALLTLQQALPADQSVVLDGRSAHEHVAITAAQVGQFDIALAIAEATEPADASLRDRIWLAIALAYADAGNFEEALAAAERFESIDRPYQPRVLAGIGLQYQSAGMREEADVTIAQALLAAEAQESSLFRVQAFNDIALEYAKAGQIESASDLLTQQVLNETTVLSEFSFLPVEIVDSWIGIGEYTLAIQATAAVEDESTRNFHLERVFEQMIADGQQTLALENIEAFTLPASQVHQMLSMAENYFQAGQTPQALPLLARAFEVAQTVPGEESQFVYLRQDLQADDVYDRGSLYEEIALAYGKMGAFEQGLEVARSLQDSQLREWVITRLDCYRNR